MDLGVGSFVFSSGLVSSRQPNTSVDRQLLTAFRSSAVILSLGIIRMVVTKAVDYQAQLLLFAFGSDWRNMLRNMEYIGTSSLLWDYYRHLWRSCEYRNPRQCRILRWPSWLWWHMNGLYIMFHFGVMITFSHSLSPVNGVISSVKIGKAFSLSSVVPLRSPLTKGYLSIFLVGLDVGNIIVSSTSPSSRKTKLIYLSITSILSILAYQLASQGFHLQVSRRLVL